SHQRRFERGAETPPLRIPTDEACKVDAPAAEVIRIQADALEWNTEECFRPQPRPPLTCPDGGRDAAIFASGQIDAYTAEGVEALHAGNCGSIAIDGQQIAGRDSTHP